MSQRFVSQSTKHLAKGLSSASLNSDQQVPIGPGLSSFGTYDAIATIEAMVRKSSSSTLSLHKFPSAPPSSSSFKQLDLQRGFNLSNLSSNKVLLKSPSSLTMENATWELTSTPNLDAGGSMMLQKTSDLATNDGPLDLSRHGMPGSLSLKDQKYVSCANIMSETTVEQDTEYVVETFAEKPIKQVNPHSMSSTEL